ncbi:hypothetical protein ACV07N_15850 [Roseivirga echinicomitans]
MTRTLLHKTGSFIAVGPIGQQSAHPSGVGVIESRREQPQSAQIRIVSAQLEQTVCSLMSTE